MITLTLTPDQYRNLQNALRMASAGVRRGDDCGRLSRYIIGALPALPILEPVPARPQQDRAYHHVNTLHSSSSFDPAAMTAAIGAALNEGASMLREVENTQPDSISGGGGDFGGGGAGGEF